VIILDSHVWIWWWSRTRDALSLPARQAIDTADEIGVPVICCVEVAQAERRNRISLDRPINVWIEQSLVRDRVRLLTLTPSIAIEASRLEWNHKDPFDRIIVATALAHRAPLVTRDDRIRRFQGVTTIW
jgi:PIN domain nuclease of toxin-antitoxin system